MSVSVLTRPHRAGQLPCPDCGLASCECPQRSALNISCLSTTCTYHCQVVLHISCLSTTCTYHCQVVRTANPARASAVLLSCCLGCGCSHSTPPLCTAGRLKHVCFCAASAALFCAASRAAQATSRSRRCATAAWPRSAAGRGSATPPSGCTAATCTTAPTVRPTQHRNRHVLDLRRPRCTAAACTITPTVLGPGSAPRPGPSLFLGTSAAVVCL